MRLRLGVFFAWSVLLCNTYLKGAQGEKRASKSKSAASRFYIERIGLTKSPGSVKDSNLRNDKEHTRKSRKGGGIRLNLLETSHHNNVEVKRQFDQSGLRVCRTQVDLGFLIDGSGSVEAYGKGNYRKCLEFVNDLTRAFEISPTDTRIGAIVFSTTSELKFDFIKFTTRQQVENAIKKITYPGRTTNAGQGLLLATDKLFNNVRQGVPRVLVVLTDGRSRDDVVAPSENLKKSGVIIFAVGLGKNYKVEQLKAMASKEFDEHVFTVDFPHISTIITSLQDKLCKEATKAVAKGTTGGETGSAGGFDLAFMVDASSSLSGEANFQFVMKLVLDVFHSFTLGGGVRYGLVVFGSSVKVVFDFTQYTSMSEVDSAVSSVTLIGGSCNAGAALTQCESALFQRNSGERARVLIVLLAGKSTDDMSSVARSLKKMGVKIIAVGMGASFDQSQLSSVASSSFFLLTAASYSVLTSISGRLSSLASQAGGISISAGGGGAEGGSCDLAFMLDASNSIQSEANFKLGKEFIKTVFHAVGLGGGRRFALVTFGSSAQVVFDFSKYSSLSDIDTAIDKVKLVKGTCAAGAALSTCQSSLFTSSGAAAATGEGAGVGANVGARLLVVMMAGKSSDSVSSVSASIKQSGVKILCVGMGGDFDTDQMTAIASSSSYFLSVSSFSALSGMSSQFISLISQAGGISTGGAGAGAGAGPIGGAVGGGAGAADLAFMLDASSNIGGAENFQMCLNFIKAVYARFTISSSGYRIGLVLFGASASVLFDFSKFYSVSEIDSALANVAMVGGSCAAGQALNTCQSALFGQSRQQAAKVLLVMMAGSSVDDVTKTATSLKNSGVHIMCLGMGNFFDKSQLTAMASSESYVQMAAEFKQLASMSSQFSTMISQISGGGNGVSSKAASVGGASTGTGAVGVAGIGATSTNGSVPGTVSGGMGASTGGATGETAGGNSESLTGGATGGVGGSVGGTTAGAAGGMGVPAGGMGAVGAGGQGAGSSATGSSSLGGGSTVGGGISGTGEISCDKPMMSTKRSLRSTNVFFGKRSLKYDKNGKQIFKLNISEEFRSKNRTEQNFKVFRITFLKRNRNQSSGQPNVISLLGNLNDGNGKLSNLLQNISRDILRTAKQPLSHHSRTARKNIKGILLSDILSEQPKDKGGEVNILEPFPNEKQDASRTNADTENSMTRLLQHRSESNVIVEAKLDPLRIGIRLQDDKQRNPDMKPTPNKHASLQEALEDVDSSSIPSSKEKSSSEDAEEDNRVLTKLSKELKEKSDGLPLKANTVEKEEGRVGKVHIQATSKEDNSNGTEVKSAGVSITTESKGLESGNLLKVLLTKLLGNDIAEALKEKVAEDLKSDNKRLHKGDQQPVDEDDATDNPTGSMVMRPNDLNTTKGGATDVDVLQFPVSTGHITNSQQTADKSPSFDMASTTAAVGSSPGTIPPVETDKLSSQTSEGHHDAVSLHPTSSLNCFRVDSSPGAVIPVSGQCSSAFSSAPPGAGHTIPIKGVLEEPPGRPAAMADFASTTPTAISVESPPGTVMGVGMSVANGDGRLEEDHGTGNGINVGGGGEGGGASIGVGHGGGNTAGSVFGNSAGGGGGSISGGMGGTTGGNMGGSMGGNMGGGVGANSGGNTAGSVFGNSAGGGGSSMSGGMGGGTGGSMGGTIGGNMGGGVGANSGGNTAGSVFGNSAGGGGSSMGGNTAGGINGNMIGGGIGGNMVGGGIQGQPGGVPGGNMGVGGMGGGIAGSHTEANIGATGANGGSTVWGTSGNTGGGTGGNSMGGGIHGQLGGIPSVNMGVGGVGGAGGGTAGNLGGSTIGGAGVGGNIGGGGMVGAGGIGAIGGGVGIDGEGFGVSRIGAGMGGANMGETSAGSAKGIEVVLDLGFLIDGSSAVGAEQNFRQILSFVSAVSHAFSVGRDMTRIGVVVYSLEAFVIFNFHTYFDIQNIDQALSTVQYPGTDGPGTYTGRGLRVTNHHLFGPSARGHSPQSLIVVAAGKSIDDVIAPAMHLRSYGIEIFCVGIGDIYSKLQLHAMASYPHSEHIFRAEYAQIGSTAQQLVTKILKGISIHFCRPCFNGHQDFCDYCPSEFEQVENNDDDEVMFERRHHHHHKIHAKPVGGDRRNHRKTNKTFKSDGDYEIDQSMYPKGRRHGDHSQSIWTPFVQRDKHHPESEGDEGDETALANFDEYKYDVGKMTVEDTECKDYSDECSLYASRGFCSEYAPTASIGTINMMCKRACGTCKEPGSKEKYAYEVVESEPFYKKTNIGLSRIRTKEVKHLQH